MNKEGYDHFSKNNELITADIEHWRHCVLKNIDESVEIVILTKNKHNNICGVCGPYSINWKNKSSLIPHYKYSHRSRTVDYYLEHCIKITPEQLLEIRESREEF